MIDMVNGGDGRAFHAAVPEAATGDVLLVGGQDFAGLPLNALDFAERYRSTGRNFTPEDTLTSSTGRVAPQAGLSGTVLVVVSGQDVGVASGATAPEFLSTGAPATAGGETYDLNNPVSSGTFTLTGGARSGAMVVDADGNLYLIGGRDSGGTLSSDIRLYAGGNFSTVAANLTTAREGHSATLLSDGTILVVGGWGNGGILLQSAEIFDPDPSYTVGPAGNPILPRAGHRAVASADGTRVLIHGGFKAVDTLAGTSVDTEVSEVYDVGLNSFTAVVSAVSPVARVYHTATRLSNGEVLLAGGVNDDAGTVTNGAQLFRFVGSTGEFRNSADTLNFARFGHTATLLADGSVLIAGGLADGTASSGSLVAAAERYIPEVR